MRSLLLLALVAAASGQTCLKDIASYTITSGDCKDQVLAFNGGFCVGTDLPLTAATAAGALGAQFEAGGGVISDLESQAECEALCVPVGGSAAAGFCDVGARCQRMFATYNSPRLACTADTQCRATWPQDLQSRISGDIWNIYRKDAPKPCCAGLFDSRYQCSGANGELYDFMRQGSMAAAELSGMCTTPDKDANCYSAATSLQLSLLAPLLAAAVGLFATRY